jgi:hypothetical protein
MTGLFGSGRLRWVTGVMLALLFVGIGFKLIAEDRPQLGALLLAFAALRVGLVITQWNEERQQLQDRPPPPGV